MKQRRRRNIKSSTFYLITFLSSLVVATAELETNRWEFNNSTNYIYDFTRVEVVGGQAELLLQAQKITEGDFLDYTSGNVTNLTLGDDVGLQLSGLPGAFPPRGVFRSGLLRGVTGNSWRQSHVNVAHAEILNIGPWVRYYKFDNDGWLDRITGSSLSVVAGTPNFSADRIIGSHSGQFSGIPDAYLSMGNNPMVGKSAMTVAMWVKARSYRNRMAVLSGFDGVNHFRIRQGVTTDQRLEFVFSLSAGAIVMVHPQALNIWYHFALAWDSNGDGKPRLYVNGVEVSVAPQSTGVITHADTVFVATDAQFPDLRAHDGFIDDLMLFDEGLTADQVERLYDGHSQLSDLFRPIEIRYRSADTESGITNKVFVGPDGTTNTFYVVDNEAVASSADFNVLDPFAQYEMALIANTALDQTPVVRSVGLIGDRNDAIDNTRYEFESGSANANVSLLPVPKMTPYIGVSKAANGGYETNGIYLSPILDAGVDSTWATLEWNSVNALDLPMPGVIALYHLDGNWGDATAVHSVNSFPNAQDFTPFAKVGTRSVIFDGESNFIDGFGDLGTIRTIEFWINALSADSPIMTLTGPAYLAIENGAVVLSGDVSSRVTVYVNGSARSPKLLTGWNHVAVVVDDDGFAVSALVVGRRTGVGFLHAYLDELAFYGTQLSDPEIGRHYSQGQRHVAGRARFQVSDNSLTNFVGPGGSPVTYAETSPFNLLGVIPNQRFLRYRILLEGDGSGTPAAGNIKVTTSPPSSLTFSNASAAVLSGGDFMDSGSALYGDRLALSTRGGIGPINTSAFSPGLIGLWHFDELNWNAGVGSVTAVQGNNGDALGDSRTTWASAVGSKAGLFDGSGDYLAGLQLPFALQFNDFTISVWFKALAQDRATVITTGSGAGFSALEVNSDGSNNVPGRVTFVAQSGAGALFAQSDLVTYNDSNWHHAALVRSGDQVLLYLDGRRSGGAESPGFGSIADNPAILVAADNVVSTFFEGAVDEVSVYNRALGEGEIGTHLANANGSVLSGEFVSQVFGRPEPSIWEDISWTTDGIYGKTLGIEDTTLVSLWHMDDVSSPIQNAVAGSPNGVVNGATFGTAGRFDEALDFDSGSSAHVVVSDDAVLRPSPERISIEAWVNMEEVSDRGILDKRSGNNGYALKTGADGRAEFWAGGAVAVGFSPVRANSWMHLAGIYDGTKLALYVNGQVESVTNAGPGSLSSLGTDLWIGRSHVGGNQYADGRIDEVAVHSRALVPEEVLDHYRAGAVRLKLQMRTSFTNTVFGDFLGPGGSNDTYFTDASGSDLVGSIPIGLYFQYRAIFESEDSSWPAPLFAVNITVSGYPISNPTIQPTESEAFPFPGHLLSFSHLRTNNVNTAIKYQISGDQGPNPRWFYWDGSAWSEEDVSGPNVYTFQANDVSDIDANIGLFYTAIYNKTGGVFRFKAFLNSGGENQAILDWVELVSAPGAINIVGPDGGEDGDLAWIAGVPHDIVWDHTITVTGSVRIEYSLNAGQSWAFVNNATVPATNVPVTNLLHVWNTPATESTNVLVRITSNVDPEVFDISDDIFTLREGLQVVDHNGGLLIWYIGETNEIVWRKSFLSPPALLEFNGTGSFVDTNTTVRITPSSIGAAALNSYDWDTPLNNPLLVSEAGKLRVRPVAAGLIHLADESDAPFILAGAVVTSPQTGEGVKKDAVFDLQWVSAGMGPTVILEVQDQPGGPWNSIDLAAPNVSGLNHYNWTPTNNPTETARLRISSTNDVRARGLTEQFTIAAIELLSPIGNADLSQSEVWLQNTTQTIAWVSGGASDFVSISFSINGGLDYMVIVSNYPNINGAGTSNSYVWVVEQLPSESVRVKIEDSIEPNNLFSETAFDFQIAGLKVLWPNGPNGLAFEWKKGVARNIVWEENAVGQFGTIEYSDDGGVSWLTVAAGPILLNLEQSYTPTNPSIRGMVRITADNPTPFTNVFDTSDALFDVAGIRPVEPTTGSEYTILETNPVTFVIAATRDADSHAPIFYSGDGGSTFDPTPINTIDDVFSEDFPGIHTFFWVVEDFRRPSLNSILKIGAGTYEELTKPFSVRGITFDDPVSSTIWAPGLRQINWSSAAMAADSVGQITYSLSRGTPGSFTNVIAAGINIADLTANWNVPPGLGPSTTAVLRIEITDSTIDPGDIGYGAFSQTFTLQGIRVLTPTVTNRFALGATDTIVWEAAIGGAFVDLFYSPDDGITYDADPISAFVPSADGLNNDAWAVELDRLPSTNARVKVVSQAFPGIEGISAPFMMRGIKVLKPRSTDIYAKLDLTNIISWAAVNDIGPGTFDVFYVVDGSVTGTVALTVGGSSLNWSIPTNAISDDVRIIVTDGIFRGTSDVFRVVFEPTVDIIDPAPNSYLPIGTDIQLRWARGGSLDNDFTAFWVFGGVTNTISTGGGISFDETNNIFSLTWEVPDNRGQIRFGVQHNTLAAVNDVSEEVNVVGQFRMLQPTSGANVYALRPNTPIVWETLGSVDFVDVYYSLSPAHEAASWVKVNSTPIANNFTPFPDPSPWVQKTFPWKVVNTRTDLARVRVQEAAYTNTFDSGASGPYADSDGNFNILYYSVYWEVFDALTTNPLDRLTVVDSSGWSASNQSTTNGIVNDYPWGTFTTEFYREGFFDASILFWESENLNISIPGPGSWTQTVLMVRSQLTESYRVLADFSYNPTNQFFTINSWLERGGVILTDPTLSTVTIFDSAGATVKVLNNTGAQSNGVFWTFWNASAIAPLSVLFAKVEIEYSGFKYNSGVTFTLDIPISAQIDALLTEVTAALQSNVLAGVSSVLTNVADVIEALSGLQSQTGTGFSNVIEIAQHATNLISGVGENVELLTNELINVVGPKLDDITNSLVRVEGNTVSSLARIVSRPGVVPFNSTNTIFYKTRSGYDSTVVQMEVFNASGGGVLQTIQLSEVINGLYQGTYSANWGVNTYEIRCSDPLARDSMLLRVTLADLYSIPTTLALLSNQLDDVEVQLVNISAATDSITNHVSPMIDLLSTNLDSIAETIMKLTNSVGINFAIIEENTAKLTNQLATLNDLDLIAEQIGLLTNALGTINEITNVSELVNGLTNALGSFTFADIAELKNNVLAIKTNVALINWNQVTDMQGNVSNIHEAVFEANGIQFDLDFVTQAIFGVDFAGLAVNLGDVTNTLSGLAGVEGDLEALTNALLGVNFAEMKDEVSSLTNSQAILAANVLSLAVDVTSLTNMPATLDGVATKLCEVTNILGAADFAALSADLQLLTNEVFRNNGLSQRVNDIWTKLVPADFNVVMDSLATTTNKLNALDALSTIGSQIDSLSNSLDTIIALTNLSSQVASIDAQLSGVDFAQLEQNISSVTNTLTQLTQLQLLTDAINSLTNSVTTLTNLNEIASTVVQLGAELLGKGLDTVAADVSDVTNQLSQLTALQDVVDTLGALTNQLDTLGGITGLVPQVDFVWNAIQGVDFTNLQAQVATVDQNTTGMDWNDILDLKLEMDFVTNAVDGLGDLPALVGSLSNTLEGVSALTNISQQVDALHSLLIGINFLSIEENLNTVTGELSEIDWAVVLEIRDDVTDMTNLLGSIGDLQQIAADLVNLTNAMAQLAGVTNIGTQVADITNALQGLNWSDVLMIKSDVQQLTNKLIGVDFSSLGGNISDLTNAIAQFAQFTNMPGQVDALASGLLGINFSALTNDVDQMATDLTGFDWNVILGLASEMSTVTNALGGLGDLSGLVGAIASLTNAVDSLSGVTNVADQVNNIESLLQALDFTELTNDVDSITQTLIDFDWSVIVNMQSQLDLTTNILGGITGLPDLINEIQGLTNAIDDIQGITNLASQIASIEAAVGGLDFAALFADVQGITNDLALLNVSVLGDIDAGIDDITNLLAQIDLTLIPVIHGTVVSVSNILSQADFSLLDRIDAGVISISNELSTLGDLSGVAADLGNLTNALAQLGNITNLGVRLGDVTNALQGLNWQDIIELKAEMDETTNALDRLSVLLPVPGVLDDLTNSLLGLDWDDILELKLEMDLVTNDIAVLADLDEIADALSGLSNSLSTITTITNLSLDISSLTNALADLSAVSQIRDDVAFLTNTFVSLGDVGSQLASVTNILSSLSGVTNIEVQLTGMSTQLTGIGQCVMTIKTNVNTLLGAVLGLTNLTAVASELSTLANASADLVTLTGLTAQVTGLSTTFASANWNDVTTIGTSLDALTVSLSAQVKDIDRTLGQVGDTAGAGTLFGRINDVDTQLGVVGNDAKNAALRSQTAKSRAGAAASAVQQLQSDIEAGDPESALRTVREVQSLLQEAKTEIDLIPKDVETSTIYTAVRDMAGYIETLAKSKGYDYLINLEGDPETSGLGDGGDGLSEDLAKSLNDNVQEVRDGMAFIQKLLDEMQNEPVVHESLLSSQ